MPTRQELEAQYRTEERRAERQALLKRIALWAAITVGLFAMVYGLAQLGAEQTKPRTGTITDQVDASDWVKGSPMAVTTLIEYGDFQCPGCASAVPFIKEIEKLYGSQLRIVFRNYPLRSIHPSAQIASQAAEAAGKQGKFWEMHDLLYANQNAWSTSKDARALFDSYAEQLGLNIERFRADLDSTAVKDKIERDVATGNRANVGGTPSFYLNGSFINYGSYDELSERIKQTIGQ